MAPVFDNRIVLEVQQANDIVDVISEHVNLRKKGREMVGLCPFHDDHRPSMNVNAAKQIFKCFACGAGGDVFKFVQMRENLTFPQAIERLAERANIKLKPIKRTRPSESQAAEQPPDVDPNRLAKANAWAADHFAKNLQHKTKGESTRDYLAQRKISPESVKTWRIGLALDGGDDLLKAAREKKVPLELLQQAGLITHNNQDKFINRLMFSITDVTGRVIGFGGRTLDDKGAKYINSPTTVLFDKSNCLYGLEQARHRIVSSATAVVVEGYTDCIMAHQFDCTNVVASLGTSLTAGHGRMLKRYAKKVVLIFDSDAAGIEAANRALDVCLSRRIDIGLASVPQGEDPCDFLLTAGKDAFEQLVAEAVDVLRFKWNRLIEKFGSDDTIAGRKSALEEYLQAIATGLWAGNVSPIEIGLIVNNISKIIGLDAKQINAQLSRRAAQAARAATYDVENQSVPGVDYGRGLFAAAQREVLEVLLNEPKLFELVKQKITAETFDVPILRQTAAILFEMLGADVSLSLNKVLAAAESVELGNCIMELAHAGEEKGKFHSRLTAALDIIQRHRHRRPAGPIKTIDDEKQFLQRLYDNTEKQNPHNVGMV